MRSPLYIKEYGPWDRFMAVPRKAKKILPKVVEQEVNKQAQSLADQIRNTITSGGAGGPSLKPATKDKKGHGIKLLDSHELANSVEAQSISVGGEGLVGIPKGKGHKGGLPIDKLAAIHEFGTARIEARPFIGPTVKKFVPKLQKKVVDAWENGIKKVF